jgi:hypothetical protein
MTEITIRQSGPQSLVYYEIQIGDWIYDGDALDIDSAMKLIKHNIKWDYRDYEKEDEGDE